jgi:hypothetical protein
VRGQQLGWGGGLVAAAGSFEGPLGACKCKCPLRACKCECPARGLVACSNISEGMVKSAAEALALACTGEMRHQQHRKY